MTEFGSLAVGDELPPLTRVVKREDVKAYADAGGDHNPLHQDEAFARSVGFDGIIAHGMFTMGHMAACVVAWAGHGAEIRRIAATFRATVSMGETIVAGGRIRALDPAARTATVETWVTLEGEGRDGFPIKRGEAVVRFP